SEAKKIKMVAGHYLTVPQKYDITLSGRGFDMGIIQTTIGILENEICPFLTIVLLCYNDIIFKLNM
ncbi:MAG TPA: hypothetical protein VIQ00_11710, partial [Chitinophagaceae bacterium]